MILTLIEVLVDVMKLKPGNTVILGVKRSSWIPARRMPLGSGPDNPDSMEFHDNIDRSE